MSAAKEIKQYDKARRELLKAEQDVVMAISPKFLQYYDEKSIEGMQELITMLPDGIAIKRRCYEALITFEKELTK